MLDSKPSIFDNEDHALRNLNITLRDSLGALAIQILITKQDISKMEYEDLLRELYKIISELHDTYHHMNGDFI